MAFYYDRNKDYHSEWIKYLQNKSFVEDINLSFTNNTKQQTNDFSNIISEQNIITPKN